MKGFMTTFQCFKKESFLYQDDWLDLAARSMPTKDGERKSEWEPFHGVRIRIYYRPVPGTVQGKARNVRKFRCFQGNLLTNLRQCHQNLLCSWGATWSWTETSSPRSISRRRPRRSINPIDNLSVSSTPKGRDPTSASSEGGIRKGDCLVLIFQHPELFGTVWGWFL